MTKAYCVPFPTMRHLVNYCNDNSIARENIVQIIDSKGQFYLFYYQ